MTSLSDISLNLQDRRKITEVEFVLVCLTFKFFLFSKLSALVGPSAYFSRCPCCCRFNALYDNI